MKSMKNFFYLALVLICTQSCSVSQPTFGSGPKNLIQNSEFAIVTPKHDTLFLCHDDMMGKFLAQCWKEGKFKCEETQNTRVVVLDCNSFEKVAQRITPATEMVANDMRR